MSRHSYSPVAGTSQRFFERAQTGKEERAQTGLPLHWFGSSGNGAMAGVLWFEIL
jgi:hypothetical protein